MSKKYARMKRGWKTRCKLRDLNAIRLVIHRTSRHIYTQVIDAKTSFVLTSASTLDNQVKKSIFGYTGNKQSASIVGLIIAKRALKIGITIVSFDRSGFKYHGRIKCLADAARKAGLKF
ncbi:50S ribosomal protein L18 [Buchnera aphidicola]|uniref:50S ribosomal protein L18 n=1 Tax=Buchnera aphidicola TaxID=9 RepID=UPI003366D454